MKSPKNPIETVDGYLAGFSPGIRKILDQLRAVILKAAPQAEEVISYQIPAYKLHGMLVYFAAYAKHIGFYPTPSGIEKFRNELTGYKTSRGAIQFPLDKPLPVSLISKIVKFRVKENIEAAEIRNKARATKKK